MTEKGLRKISFSRFHERGGLCLVLQNFEIGCGIFPLKFSAAEHTARDFVFDESSLLKLINLHCTKKHSRISSEGPFDALGNMQQIFADAVLTQIQGEDREFKPCQFKISPFFCWSSQSPDRLGVYVKAATPWVRFVHWFRNRESGNNHQVLFTAASCELWGWNLQGSFERWIHGAHFWTNKWRIFWSETEIQSEIFK